MLSYEEKMRMFYIAGAVIFIIVAVFNTASLFMNWKLLILPSKVSSIFNNIFGYLISWMFYEMWKNAKPVVINDKNIEEIFNKE